MLPRLGFVATIVLLCALLVALTVPDAYAASALGSPQRAHHSGGSSKSSGSRSSTKHSSTPRSYSPQSHAPRSSAARIRSYTAPKRGSETPRVKAPNRHSTAEHYSTRRVEHAPGARDSHGRLTRSAKAKDDFEKSTGHPHGWKGHVVDHVVPLACGGSDSPSNMQWQTTAEAKDKDKTERKGCSKR